VKTALIACATALLAIACGNNATKSDTSTATSTPAASASIQKCENRTMPKPAPQTDTKTKPTVTVPDGAPPCKLVTQDIKIGTGAEANPSANVTVQYVGVSWSTKAQFDSSWDRGGQPVSFPLGQVIQGWQQGIPGMKEGGRRLLIVPPDLGYGAAGNAGIAPGETLVFIVDLVKAG
jgi:peptidylprolyl isomerase